MERPGSPESEPQTSYLVKHSETGEVFDIYASRFETVEGLLREGLYRHYKSAPGAEKYYTVERVVKDVETEDHFVIYHPEYETVEKEIYARPLENFMETVKVRDGEIPKFRHIGPTL